jgi:putative ABC transport system permease protein
VGSLALSRVLATLLYQVSPSDPGALAGTIGGVLVVALAASYVPARRATRVDPAIALRAE